jgi:hypothetical protein
MATKTEFVLKEKKIVDFYNQHPSINCEKANLLLVDFLETMFNHITDDLGTNVNSQLLSFMNENKTQLHDLQQQVSSYREEVSKTHQEATSEVFTQLSSWKTKYMDDVKQLIENNQLSSNEKIGTFLDKNNMQLLDKTAILLNDAIPKNHNVLHQQIVYSLKEFNRQITEDTSKILTTSNNQNSMEQYIQTFENKYTTMLQGIQQPLFSVLSSTEERLSKNIDGIREFNSQSLLSQKPVLDELGEFLGKYNMSSNKGKYGEQNLCSILTTMFPSAEIQDTTGLKASGDFILRRVDKPSILLENKEYKANIDKEEISKFIRDIDTQNTNGIFLSQYSGITFKQNYQIDIHKGNILVYVQNCEYSNERIQIAIDIIDYLSVKIQELNIDDTNNISKEILDDINMEYQSFISQKEIMVTCLKDFNKKMSSQIDGIRMPALDKYLDSKYAYVKTRTHVCDICNDFTGSNKQSISAHKRGCRKKHLSSNTVVTDTSSNSIEQNIEQV